MDDETIRHRLSYMLIISSRDNCQSARRTCGNRLNPTKVARELARSPRPPIWSHCDDTIIDWAMFMVTVYKGTGSQVPGAEDGLTIKPAERSCLTLDLCAFLKATLLIRKRFMGSLELRSSALSKSQAESISRGNIWSLPRSLLLPRCGTWFELIEPIISPEKQVIVIVLHTNPKADVVVQSLTG
jgi:hypothetical protein